MHQTGSGCRGLGSYAQPWSWALGLGLSELQSWHFKEQINCSCHVPELQPVFCQQDMARMSYYMHPASSLLPCRAGHVISLSSHLQMKACCLSVLWLRKFPVFKADPCLPLTFHQLLWCLLGAGVFLDLGLVRV